ncbi:discoidin domain-containing protein [bacterium]|nr:discoidin domain-containing protein [bacterium]
MPAEQKNSFRSLVPAALLVLFLSLPTALLLIYIRHLQPQFGGISPEWVVYTVIQLFNDIREGRLYDSALAYGVFIVAWILTRRIVDHLRIADPLPRFLAFASLIVLALLLPFHLLAFISLYANLPCLSPYNLLLILLAALLVAKLLFPKPAAPIQPQTPRPSFIGITLGGAGLMLFAAMALLVAAATQQSYRGYDGLWYHLPTALMWRDWRLSANFAPHYAFHYPSNAEALLYYFICARAFAALTAMQLISAAIGSLAVARICRLLRFDAWAAWLAGSAFFLLPVTINQVLVIGNDIFLAMLLLLTACFLMEAHAGEPPRPRMWLSLSSLVYGCAIGTKYNAIFFAPVFAAWAAWIVVRRMNEPAARAILIRGAVLMLLALLPSAFWFCRNCTLHDNPLYPFQVSVAGQVIFKGEPAQAFRADKEAEFVSAPRQWWYYPFVEKFRWSQSWGGTLAAFMYMIPFIPLFFAIRNRKKNTPLAAAHAFCFLIMLLGWVTWAALTAREPRYNLFVFGIMIASAAGLMSIGPPVCRRAMGVLFLATLLVNSYFTAELIAERYWLETDHARPELTLPGFEDAINAAPPGTVLARSFGRFSLVLYGEGMRNRVRHTLLITTGQLTAFQPDLVADSANALEPYQSALVGNPAYRLVREAVHGTRRYLLYQRATPRPAPNAFFAKNPPSAIRTSSQATTETAWRVLDGKLNTGWSAGSEPNPWIELDWKSPIAAGWLELSWIKLDCEKYRVRVHRNGKWKTVARMENAPRTKPFVQKFRLDRRGFDAIRIEARQPKRPSAKPPKIVFNLAEVKGYPPMRRGDIALALALIIGLALSPFEFRSTRIGGRNG